MKEESTFHLLRKQHQKRKLHSKSPREIRGANNNEQDECYCLTPQPSLHANSIKTLTPKAFSNSRTIYSPQPAINKINPSVTADDEVEKIFELREKDSDNMESQIAKLDKIHIKWEKFKKLRVGCRENNKRNLRLRFNSLSAERSPRAHQLSFGPELEQINPNGLPMTMNKKEKAESVILFRKQLTKHYSTLNKGRFSDIQEANPFQVFKSKPSLNSNNQSAEKNRSIVKPKKQQQASEAQMKYEICNNSNNPNNSYNRNRSNKAQIMVQNYLSKAPNRKLLSPISVGKESKNNSNKSLPNKGSLPSFSGIGLLSQSEFLHPGMEGTHDTRRQISEVELFSYSKTSRPSTKEDQGKGKDLPPEISSSLRKLRLKRWTKAKSEIENKIGDSENNLKEEENNKIRSKVDEDEDEKSKERKERITKITKIIKGRKISRRIKEQINSDIDENNCKEKMMKTPKREISEIKGIIPRTPPKFQCEPKEKVGEVIVVNEDERLSSCKNEKYNILLATAKRTQTPQLALINKSGRNSTQLFLKRTNSTENPRGIGGNPLIFSPLCTNKPLQLMKQAKDLLNSIQTTPNSPNNNNQSKPIVKKHNKLWKHKVEKNDFSEYENYLKTYLNPTVKNTDINSKDRAKGRGMDDSNMSVPEENIASPHMNSYRSVTNNNVKLTPGVIDLPLPLQGRNLYETFTPRHISKQEIDTIINSPSKYSQSEVGTLKSPVKVTYGQMGSRNTEELGGITTRITKKEINRQEYRTASSIPQLCNNIKQIRAQRKTLSPTQNNNIRDKNNSNNNNPKEGIREKNGQIEHDSPLKCVENIGINKSPKYIVKKNENNLVSRLSEKQQRKLTAEIDKLKGTPIHQLQSIIISDIFNNHLNPNQPENNCKKHEEDVNNCYYLGNNNKMNSNNNKCRNNNTFKKVVENNIQNKGSKKDWKKHYNQILKLRNVVNDIKTPHPIINNIPLVHSPKNNTRSSMGNNQQVITKSSQENNQINNMEGKRTRNEGRFIRNYVSVPSLNRRNNSQPSFKLEHYRNNNNNPVKSNTGNHYNINSHTNEKGICICVLIYLDKESNLLGRGRDNYCEIVDKSVGRKVMSIERKRSYSQRLRNRKASPPLNINKFNNNIRPKPPQNQSPKYSF